MTPFNPKNLSDPTYEDILGPAMEITSQEDADQYKEKYVAFIQDSIDSGKVSSTEDSAEEIANHNLGYYAGYYSSEVRRRVEKLFKCHHPIFGSIEENGVPTAEEALRLGIEAGKKSKKSNS